MFYNKLNIECWNFTISSEGFVTPTTLSNLKWILTPLFSRVKENFRICFSSKIRDEWNQLRSENCRHDSTAKSTEIFFSSTCSNTHKKHDKRQPGLLRKEFRCSERACLCSKTYFCYDRNSKKYKSSSRKLNKGTLEECGDAPITKYCGVLEESVNVTLTKRGFRTLQRCFAT